MATTNPEGMIAGALLFGGGKQALDALQAGAISTGLPFVVLLLVMCVSLYIGLHRERRLAAARSRALVVGWRLGHPLGGGVLKSRHGVVGGQCGAAGRTLSRLQPASCL